MRSLLFSLKMDLLTWSDDDALNGADSAETTRILGLPQHVDNGFEWIFSLCMMRSRFSWRWSAYLVWWRPCTEPIWSKLRVYYWVRRSMSTMVLTGIFSLHDRRRWSDYLAWRPLRHVGSTKRFLIKAYLRRQWLTSEEAVSNGFGDYHAITSGHLSLGDNQELFNLDMESLERSWVSSPQGRSALCKDCGLPTAAQRLGRQSNWSHLCRW